MQVCQGGVVPKELPSPQVRKDQGNLGSQFMLTFSLRQTYMLPCAPTGIHEPAAADRPHFLSGWSDRELRWPPSTLIIYSILEEAKKYCRVKVYGGEPYIYRHKYLGIHVISTVEIKYTNLINY